jgi:hypothetical protein
MTITKLTKSKLSVVYCLKYNQFIMGGLINLVILILKTFDIASPKLTTFLPVMETPYHHHGL